jgi:isoleucyl-tRNA synthetase
VADEPMLEAAMAGVRRLCNLGRAAREAVGINVRQPLAELVCVVPHVGGQAEAERLARALDALVQTELNVKRVRWAESGDALVQLEAKANFRALGKRFGKATPLAAEAVARLGREALHAFERGEPVAVSVEGSEHLLQPDDLTILRRATGELVVQEEGGFVVALDPRVTPELRREGMARELVSRVQRMRKDAGLLVSDRIRLALLVEGEVAAAVEEHREHIAGEVLARRLTFGTTAASPGADALDPTLTQTFELDGSPVTVTLSKDDS